MSTYVDSKFPTIPQHYVQVLVADDSICSGTPRCANGHGLADKLAGSEKVGVLNQLKLTQRCGIAHREAVRGL